MGTAPLLNLNSIASLKQTFAMAVAPEPPQDLTQDISNINLDGASLKQSGHQVQANQQSLETGKNDIKANITQLEQQNKLVASQAMDHVVKVGKEYGYSEFQTRMHFAQESEFGRGALESIPSNTVQIIDTAIEAYKSFKQIPAKTLAEIADKAALSFNKNKPSAVSTIAPTPVDGAQLIEFIEEGIHSNTIKKLETNLSDIESKQAHTNEIEGELDKGETLDTDPDAQFTYEDSMGNCFNVAGITVPNQAIINSPTPFDPAHEINTPQNGLDAQFKPATMG